MQILHAPTCSGLEKLEAIKARYHSQARRQSAKVASKRLIDTAIEEHTERCSTCQAIRAAGYQLSACAVADALQRSEFRLRQRMCTARNMFAKDVFAEAAKQLKRERHEHTAVCSACLASERQVAA